MRRLVKNTVRNVISSPADAASTSEDGSAWNATGKPSPQASSMRRLSLLNPQSIPAVIPRPARAPMSEAHRLYAYPS